MKVYFDTTVLVAACVEPHPHYRQSISALHSARDKKLEAHISGHALAEAYSVLTRTPFRSAHLSFGLAWKLLEEEILPYFEIVTITPRMYRETIRECADRRLDRWPGSRRDSPALRPGIGVRANLYIQCTPFPAASARFGAANRGALASNSLSRHEFPFAMSAACERRC